MTVSIQISLVTPLFSHGATNAPEIRAPSVRGMLHQWFRILGGTIAQEREVFGGVKFKTLPNTRDSASKIVVRVKPGDLQTGSRPTLPHKTSDSRRNCYLPGGTFSIFISDRLGGLNNGDRELFLKALKAWLLMGTLGFRSTRGGGSFSWQWDAFPMPENPEAYQAACREVLNDAASRVAVLGTPYSTAEEARKTVSDSLGGPVGDNGQNDLRDLNEPLGCIRPRRKTSPLKYRIVPFGNTFRILAFWDGRRAVTGNSIDDFYGIVDLLAERKPELGRQLKAAFG